MRRNFRWKRNRDMFANRDQKSGEESIGTKIRGFFIVMGVIVVPLTLGEVSRISFQVSYWIGLTWRVIVFASLLVIILTRLLIPKLVDVIHKKISLINVITSGSLLFTFALYILIAAYFKVIPYIQDTFIAYNHNYSVVEEESVVNMDWKSDYFSKRPRTIGVIMTIRSKCGETMEITFNDAPIKETNKHIHCKIEYLPHSMLGINLEENLEEKERYIKNQKINEEYIHKELNID